MATKNTKSSPASAGIVPAGTTVNPWWLVLLQGVLFVFIGWFLLSSPVKTVIFLVQVLGFYWLISGIMNVVFSLTIIDKEKTWIWKLLGGIIGIIAGLFVLNNQLFATVLTPVVFTYFIAFTFLINGIVQMFAGGKKSGSKWADFFIGLFDLILGLILLSMPLVTSVATVVFTVGLLSMFGGIVTILLSFQVKSSQK